jgi:NADPH:quinone reductase-like Zn-dependent oxidoreductase
LPAAKLSSEQLLDCAILEVCVKAMKLKTATENPVLVAVELPQPEPAEGELLIRVRASGVTPTEVIWYPTTHTKEGRPRENAVPGHEFSGIVAALGNDVDSFRVGDEVYGMNDWFADGATAEFCLTQPQNIALKPKSLSHELAATVPIGALTAWQGLVDRARMQPGDRVLIHGAAGAVGLFAVQLAHLRRAYVIATASATNVAFVTALGADEVIDYKASRFEEQAKNIEIVFDTVGGETLDRSWKLLKPGGRLVTIAANGEGTTDQRVKDAFFIVEPNQKQLVEVARLLNAGSLKTFIRAVVPLEDAAFAYSREMQKKRPYGKVVIAVPA